MIKGVKEKIRSYKTKGVKTRGHEPLLEPTKSPLRAGYALQTGAPHASGGGPRESAQVPGTQESQTEDLQEVTPGSAEAESCGSGAAPPLVATTKEDGAGGHDAERLDTGEPLGVGNPGIRNGSGQSREDYDLHKEMRENHKIISEPRRRA